MSKERIRITISVLELATKFIDVPRIKQLVQAEINTLKTYL